MFPHVPYHNAECFRRDVLGTNSWLKSGIWRLIELLNWIDALKYAGEDMILEPHFLVMFLEFRCRDDFSGASCLG